VKQIPNLLSAARFLIAPWLFYALWQHEYGLSLALSIVAGITDGLDGLAARRFGASSRIGAYLDPLADKVLLSGAYLTLALSGAIDPWLAILVLGRDVLILVFVGIVYLATKLRTFPPSFWGKASTCAQIAYILAFLARSEGLFPAFLVTLGKWIAVGLTSWSAIHYAWIGTRMFGRNPQRTFPVSNS
jgi:cardiolipin synthase (CMP-forming)